MKKLLLLALSAGLTFGATAQNYISKQVGTISKSTATSKAAKTTFVTHSNLVMKNFGPADDNTLWTTSYPHDSGFTSGTNFAGVRAWAERYTFNAADSSIQVVGIAGIFVGTVNYASATPHKINLKLWNSGSKTATSRPTLWFTGFPTTGIDSIVNIPDTALSITDTTADYTGGLFSAPTAYLSDTFFVGYTCNYDWNTMNGDTIAVATTKNGNRDTASNPTYPYLTVGGTGDTTVNVANCIMTAGGTWLDNGYNLGLRYNYWIFPVVNTKVWLGVNSGITRNNFTFYGNYPNPAVTNTNVKFSLANSTDVTISVMDLRGKVISTTNNANMSAGEHTISIETSNLAAGNYIYVIRTAEGDGIASQLSVIK